MSEETTKSEQPASNRDGRSGSSCNDLLSAISAMRRQLDRMEELVRELEGVPAKSLSLNQWLDLHEYPTVRGVRRNLEKADELLHQGYSFDEIVRIFRWHNKKSFLPVLERFCRERSGG